MSYDWIETYLRAPFRDDAYGEDGHFDCYGLAWHVATHQGGQTWPRFDDMEGQMARINAAIRGQELSEDWLEVPMPQEFDIVVMRRADEAYHVGIWLNVDGGKVLHTSPKGVYCTDLNALRRMQFRNITFHRYVKTSA